MTSKDTFGRETFKECPFVFVKEITDANKKKIQSVSVTDVIFEIDNSRIS